MSKKKTTFFSDPDDKRLGVMAIGSKDVELPADALVSITVFEKLSLFHFILNGILGHLVAFQMKRTNGMLYAELGGRIDSAVGCTISVWDAKAMVPFRDSGAHGRSMKKFRWVFGGKAQTYFLTFKANGRIPTYKEAVDLGKSYGRHYDGNKLVRNATKPVW